MVLTLNTYLCLVWTYRNQYWLWTPIIATITGGVIGAGVYEGLLADQAGRVGRYILPTSPISEASPADTADTSAGPMVKTGNVGTTPREWNRTVRRWFDPLPISSLVLPLLKMRCLFALFHILVVYCAVHSGTTS